MEYANRIRKIREAYHLKQSEVALKIGMEPSSYGKIERRAGKSSIETLKKVAIAIGVSLPFLIDIENSEVIELRKDG